MGELLTKYVAEWVDDLVDEGLSRESARESVARFLRDLAKHDSALAKALDAAVDFEKAVPGAFGRLLEKHDEAAWRALIGLVTRLDNLFKRDPVKVAARQKRRADKKDRRRHKRDREWLIRRLIAVTDDEDELALLEVMLSANGG